MNELEVAASATVLASVVGWLAAALRSATPLLWAMLGETFVQRAGVINLGAEGQMLIGAATAYAVTADTGDPWRGLGAGALAGVLLSVMHALLCLCYRANHFASGISVWMIGFGASSYLGAGFVGESITGLPTPAAILGSKVALLDQLGVTAVGALIAVPLCALALYATRTGLNLRAVGESVTAARAAGLRAVAYQWSAVLAGGLFSGIGGAALSIDITQSWAEGMTQGIGLIAAGLVIVARWNPWLALPAALVFGGAAALSLRAQAEGAVSAHLLHTLPYFISLAVFVLTCVRYRTAGAPAGLRVALDLGMR
jgi:ABC-type uncharacterized transport system permease subunit